MSFKPAAKPTFEEFEDRARTHAQGGKSEVTFCYKELSDHDKYNARRWLYDEIDILKARGLTAAIHLNINRANQLNDQADRLIELMERLRSL